MTKLPSGIITKIEKCWNMHLDSYKSDIKRFDDEGNNVARDLFIKKVEAMETMKPLFIIGFLYGIGASE